MPFYPPPVDRLLKLGGEPARRNVWPDYRHLGLTARHVPALIEMAADSSLRGLPERDKARWAPVHAWRTLGLLEAAEAAEPLLRVLERDVADPWVFLEVPQVLGMIGAPTLPGATLVLFDEARDERVRVGAARAMTEVAHEHPDRRDEVVAVLTRQLEDWKLQTPRLNGLLVMFLGEMGAAEAAPVMEAAFAAEAVDLTVNGDWEDAQLTLGLIDERTTPPTPWSEWYDDEPLSGRVQAVGRQADQARSRRKAQKQARKRNRRR